MVFIMFSHYRKHCKPYICNCTCQLSPILYSGRVGLHFDVYFLSISYNASVLKIYSRSAAWYDSDGVHDTSVTLMTYSLAAGIVAEKFIAII